MIAHRSSAPQTPPDYTTTPQAHHLNPQAFERRGAVSHRRGTLLSPAHRHGQGSLSKLVPIPRSSTLSATPALHEIAPSSNLNSSGTPPVVPFLRDYHVVGATVSSAVRASLPDRLFYGSFDALMLLDVLFRKPPSRAVAVLCPLTYEHDETRRERERSLQPSLERDGNGLSRVQELGLPRTQQMIKV